MYDTVNLVLKKDYCPKTDFIKNIPKNLTKIEREGYNHVSQNKFVDGDLKGLKVKIHANRVNIYKRKPL